MIIYTISGFGIHQDVFKGLQLEAAYTLVHLPFLSPHSGEMLANYAKRMAAQIPENKGDIALLGLSFGGLLAVEMAKHLRCSTLLLISTVKCHKELPWFIKINKYLPLYRLMPVSWFKKVVLQAGKWVKVTNDKNLKRFEQVLENCDDAFYKWGAHQLIHWRGCVAHKQAYLHIHGEKDTLFPSEKINYVMLLKEATHFMIITRHREVSTRINHYLNTLEILPVQ